MITTMRFQAQRHENFWMSAKKPRSAIFSFSLMRFPLLPLGPSRCARGDAPEEMRQRWCARSGFWCIFGGIWWFSMIFLVLTIFVGFLWSSLGILGFFLLVSGDRDRKQSNFIKKVLAPKSVSLKGPRIVGMFWGSGSRLPCFVFSLRMLT